MNKIVRVTAAVFYATCFTIPFLIMAVMAVLLPWWGSAMLLAAIFVFCFMKSWNQDK